jgi:DNA-binding transcriptional MerR regulator
MKISELNLDSLSGQALAKALQTDLWGTMRKVIDLTLPQFAISEIGITHRWITHWDNQGLIDNHREGTEWRRFSFIEYIWLRIIVRLREFNLPLAAIKRVKKFLWAPVAKQDFELAERDFLQAIKAGEVPIPPGKTLEEFEKTMKAIFKNPKIVADYINTLFLIVYFMQLYKKPYCLLIEKSGECGAVNFATEELAQQSLAVLVGQIDYSDFICINLYKILQEFFSNEKIEDEVMMKIALLTEKEEQILGLIQAGDFTELSIKLNNNKQYLVKVKRNKSLERITNEVSSIISRGKYQDIKLVTQEGKIILAEVTDKIKI